MSDLGISAAKAYQTAAQSLQQATGLEQSGASQGPAFGDFLSNAIGSVSQAGVSAETAITQASLGRADLVDVVTAVAAAEATLETVIAVRDEVIKAYQDIMRMPI